VETIKESYEMSIFSEKKSKIHFFRISPKMFWEGVKEHCAIKPDTTMKILVK